MDTIHVDSLTKRHSSWLVRRVVRIIGSWSDTQHAHNVVRQCMNSTAKVRSRCFHKGK